MAQLPGRVHMTELDLEDVQERIMELISNDPATKMAVDWEHEQRFPTRHLFDQKTLDETYLMCQLHVWGKILSTVV